MDVLIRYSGAKQAEADLCRSGSFHLVKRISHQLTQQNVLVEKFVEFVYVNCQRPKCQIELLSTSLLNTIIEDALHNCTQAFCLKALDVIKIMIKLPEALDKLEHSIQTSPLTNLINYQKDHNILISTLEVIHILCKERKSLIESIVKTDNGITKISSVSAISSKLKELSIDLFSLFVSQFSHFAHLIIDLPLELLECLMYKINLELAIKTQGLLKYLCKVPVVLKTLLERDKKGVLVLNVLEFLEDEKIESNKKIEGINLLLVLITENKELFAKVCEYSYLELSLSQCFLRSKEQLMPEILIANCKVIIQILTYANNRNEQLKIQKLIAFSTNRKVLEAILSFIDKATLNNELELIKVLFDTLYSVFSFDVNIKAVIVQSVAKAIKEVVMKITEPCYELYKLCTFYVNDSEFDSYSLVDKEFIVKLMKCLKVKKIEMQEHLLTLVYTLSDNETFVKRMREIIWENGLHYLIELYPKYREPISYIMLKLSKVILYLHI